MKKFNFNINPKFNINTKVILFGISTLIFIYLLYLSIPSLYKSGRVQKVLTQEILSEFDLNISLSPKITYRILPTPHFSINDSKLFNSKNNVNKEIGQFKQLKVYIKQTNFFNKDQIKIKKISVKNGNFFLKKNDLNFITNYINKKFSDKRIEIKNSKIFFNDENNKPVFIYSIKKLDINYNTEDINNIIILNGEIFKIPNKIKWQKDFSDNNKILKINLKKPNAEMINKSLFENNKYIHQNEISILNSKLRTNFKFSDGSIKFKSSQSIIKNTPVNFQGNIDIKPFYVETNLETKSFDLNYFFNNSFWFNEIVKSKLIQNENLNGKIFIRSDKILKNKIFDSINFVFNINQGNFNFNDTVLISKKIGNLKILNSSFLNNENKFVLEAKVSLDIKNKDAFYKKFLISKKKRKGFKKFEVIFEFDTIDKNFRVNKVNFYGLNDKRVFSEKIDDLVDNYADRRFDYLNSISFRNYLKEVFETYYEFG